MTLLAANFGAGSISSIAINADGSLGALVSTIQAAGSGPHKRQAGPHAHGAVVDPSGRFALVSDLGADRVFVDGFDRATHALSPADPAHPRAFAAPAGSGPHRAVFGADGRFVYLFNELSAELLTLRWDARGGQLALVQSLQTSSAEFKGVKSGSELALGRDGRFAYVENRGENALVVYRVDPVSGELAFVQRIACGGEKPWSFAIDGSGRWMLVANQQSNRVSLLRIDPASGLLADTGQAVEAPAPLSVAFVH
jgi:6-phosphogluconolactonase